MMTETNEVTITIDCPLCEGEGEGEEQRVSVVCPFCEREENEAKKKKCKQCNGEGTFEAALEECSRCQGERKEDIVLDMDKHHEVTVPDDICVALWRRDVISTGELGVFSVSNLFDMVRRIERDSPEEA